MFMNQRYIGKVVQLQGIGSGPDHILQDQFRISAYMQDIWQAQPVGFIHQDHDVVPFIEHPLRLGKFKDGSDDDFADILPQQPLQLLRRLGGRGAQVQMDDRIALPVVVGLVDRQPLEGPVPPPDLSTPERRGEYLGKTVQVIPHITDEIKRSIRLAADGVDIVIVEIGGTIGDIESLPFLEAIRQFQADAGKDNVLYIHLTLVPYIGTAGEVKTKPTQHSVKELRSIGIQPDILLCRTDRYLSKDIKSKIGLFCNVGVDAVVTAKDVECIYEVPLVFHKEGLDNKIVELLKIWTRAPRHEAWSELVEKIQNAQESVTIAIVGKYVDLTESYKSLNEALVHAGIKSARKVNIHYVDSELLETEGVGSLEPMDAILVPGGFGERGVEGKIAAARYAREEGVPCLGLCLGLQAMAIEFMDDRFDPTLTMREKVTELTRSPTCISSIALGPVSVQS